MAPSHELLIIKAQDGVVRVQKVGVENHLDPVRWGIEQFDAAKLVQNGVVGIVRHVVRYNRGVRTAFERKYPPLQQHLVLRRQEGIRLEFHFALPAGSRM